MTPERFTNLDTWSQALEPGPCKTALRELVAHIIRLTTQLESERKLVAQLAEEGQGLAAERDAFRKRVAVLEQRLDDVPCGWTEPVPDYPRKRVRAGILGGGA